MEIRQQALTAIQWFAQQYVTADILLLTNSFSKPKQIPRHNLIQPILHVAFSMLAEVDDDEDEEEFEVTAHKVNLYYYLNF